MIFSFITTAFVGVLFTKNHKQTSKYCPSLQARKWNFTAGQEDGTCYDKMLYYTVWYGITYNIDIIYDMIRTYGWIPDSTVSLYFDYIIC